MMQADQKPVLLTATGRRRLERRLEAYEVADHASRLLDLIATTRAIVARALPLPTGPADGVIRQGSTVLVRDATGEESDFILVDGAELDSSLAAILLQTAFPKSHRQPKFGLFPTVVALTPQAPTRYRLSRSAPPVFENRDAG